MFPVTFHDPLYVTCLNPNTGSLEDCEVIVQHYSPGIPAIITHDPDTSHPEEPEQLEFILIGEDGKVFDPTNEDYKQLYPRVLDYIDAEVKYQNSEDY